MPDSNSVLSSPLIDLDGAQVLVDETKDYVDKKQVELTLAEYNALPSSKYTDGVEYFITDTPGTQGVTADDVSYDNTSSGLTADTVQEAIDEVADEVVGKANGEGISFFVRNGGLIVGYDDGQ